MTFEKEPKGGMELSEDRKLEIRETISDLLSCENEEEKKGLQAKLATMSEAEKDFADTCALRIHREAMMTRMERMMKEYIEDPLGFASRDPDMADYFTRQLEVHLRESGLSEPEIKEKLNKLRRNEMGEDGTAN